MKKTSQRKERRILDYLGISSINRTVFLFSRVQEDRRKTFLQIASSSDGVNFKICSENPIIYDEKSGKEEIVKKCKNFRIVRLDRKYFLTYKFLTTKNRYKICGAISDDLIHWKKVGKLSKIGELGAMVADYNYKGKYVIYFGESSIKIAFSKNLKTWKVLDEPVLEPRNDYFDNPSLEVGNCIVTNEGISLIYYVKGSENIYHSIGVAFFDRNDPTKLLWRSNEPVWERSKKWKNQRIYPIGVVQLDGNSFSYWSIEGEGIKAIIFPPISQTKPILERFGEPIIKPIPQHAWESLATFNPAAVYEGGKVHIVYRAIGNEGISVLGYAASKNGIHIDERLREPIFVHQVPKCSKDKTLPFYSPIAGWRGGCEDPRITKIEDKFYMTFVSFDGRNPPRVALTSIKVNDFLNKQWNWEKPVLISPPGVVDKNACILPEKINGKYVIFHRIFPSILIDFVDDLNFEGNTWLKGQFSIGPRKGMWDSRKIGAGAPPIKTKDGWLLIYHGVGDKDPFYRYRVGAMLLDINDPTRVLYRCKKPILEDEDDSNISYPCGAVVIKNKLFVYYGCGDRTVKVATADLGEFLDELKDLSEPKIMTVNLLKF